MDLVKSRREGQKNFQFTAEQTRTKFMSCVAACKKASMARKTGSGIAHFIQTQPDWFKQLVPLESRDSCNPDMAVDLRLTVFQV